MSADVVSTLLPSPALTSAALQAALPKPTSPCVAPGLGGAAGARGLSSRAQAAAVSIPWVPSVSLGTHPHRRCAVAAAMETYFSATSPSFFATLPLREGSRQLRPVPLGAAAARGRARAHRTVIILTGSRCACLPAPSGLLYPWSARASALFENACVVYFRQPVTLDIGHQSSVPTWHSRTASTGPRVVGSIITGLLALHDHFRILQRSIFSSLISF